MADTFAREDALAALTSLSLLKQEVGPAGPVFIFHRLLLDVARDWMGADARALWGGAAAQLVNGAFPGEAHENPSQWPLCARLMPHVAPLAAHAPQTGATGKALDRLLNDANFDLAARGDRAGALKLAEQSVALRRHTRTNEPLELATGLNNLARRYDDLDRLDDAEAAYREALAIKEPRLDPNDPNLAIPLSNLAGGALETQAF
jgi:tetratricopeptide (TPR) repeat protein